MKICCEYSNVMLLLPSRKSALNDPNMVLSQIRSFNAHSNCEQEREDNNNTLIADKDVLRTPPPKCRFHVCRQTLNELELFMIVLGLSVIFSITQSQSVRFD